MVVGIRQLFLDTHVTFVVPTADEFNPEIVIPTIAPFLLSAHTGVTKKLFFRSANLGLFAGFGLESLNLSGTLLGESYTYSVRALGAKVGLDFEKMITPDLSVNLGVQYKVASPVAQVGLTIGEDAEEITYTPDEWEFNTGMDLGEMNLSGIGFTLGVNYALSELPVNLFGALDPFKKY